MKKILVLTPEQHVALHAIPATAEITRYYFWCGIFAVNGLKLPDTIHNCPKWEKDPITGFKMWTYQ